MKTSGPDIHRGATPRGRPTTTAVALAALLATALPLGLAGCAPFMQPGPEPPTGPLARDPGVRLGVAGAGAALTGLSTAEQAVFEAGRLDFADVETGPDGLGPTFNLDSCGGCHLQPALGGSSPPANPQLGVASRMGAGNRLPPFIRADGPVREARFVRNADGSADGGVHALFTIAGRSDAPGCALAQPDFAAELARDNVIFRIPTPVFGAGLIEQIADDEIERHQASQTALKQRYGIVGKANIVLPFHAVSGQPNKNGNDGTIGRFGWKAQNKSLLVFAGEAYNVEMGITNEAFPTERDETTSCQFAPLPNDITRLDAATLVDGLSAIEKFAHFMRLLAPPQPSADQPGGAASIQRGREQFDSLGCALCHTPAMQTGQSAVAALRRQTVALYSDLLVHDMGHGLADGVSQGQASGREFRSAPLWGLGQRIFLLHDGRTADLREAIDAHASRGSEANGVIANYRRLAEAEKQHLYNFLRSL